MKTNRHILRLGLAAVMILLCANSGWCADDEADRTALRTIKAAYEEAINSKDPSKMAPHLATNVTGVMVTGDVVEGFQGLEAYWKKIQALIGEGGKYQVKVNTDKTDLFGEVAVSRGNTEDVVTLANGKEFKFGSRWTAVCHKETGGWKVIRMQATMDPVDNVFTSARLKTTKFVYGGAGLAAGVLLLLMMRFSKRARP
jgi:uncharacterized protein (TIGR02246 family)